MFIAMNRFRVGFGNEPEFEQVWRSRKSYLAELDGFVQFALLRGPGKDGYTLYASHTVWSTKKHFDAWTRSGQFRAAHARAGQGKPLTLGHPEFEGFEAVLVEDNRAVASVKG